MWSEAAAVSLSVAETKSLLTRAGVGAGLDPGAAEEVAAAGLLLFGRGVDGAAIAAAALAQRDGCFHAAFDGPAALGALAADGDVRRLDRVDAPGLLAALAAEMSAEIGAEIAVEGPAGAAAPLDAVTEDLKLRLRADAPAAPWPPVPARCAASDAAVSELEALARRTLVPATDASRARGAGVGADPTE